MSNPTPLLIKSEEEPTILIIVNYECYCKVTCLAFQVPLNKLTDHYRSLFDICNGNIISIRDQNPDPNNPKLRAGYELFPLLMGSGEWQKYIKSPNDQTLWGLKETKIAGLYNLKLVDLRSGA